MDLVWVFWSMVSKGGALETVEGGIVVWSEISTAKMGGVIGGLFPLVCFAVLFLGLCGRISLLLLLVF